MVWHAVQSKIKLRGLRYVRHTLYIGGNAFIFKENTKIHSVSNAINYLKSHNEIIKFDKIPSFNDISKVWNHKLLGDYKGLQSEGFVKKKSDS